MNLTDFRTEAKRDAEEVIRQARELTTGLTVERLNERSSDAWSIGQIFEHMLLAQRPYVAKIGGALANGGSKGGAEAKHSFMGKFIINSMLPGTTKQVPVPKIFEPSSGPFEVAVVQEFLGLQAEMLELLSRSEGYNLNKIKVASPVSGLIRLSLTDAFRLFNVHNVYHLGQVKARLNGKSA